MEASGKLRVRLAHQDQPGFGNHSNQPSKSPQRFGDALVRLQKSEDADQWRAFVEPQARPVRHAVRLHDPGAMRNLRHRTLEAVLAHHSRHRVAVYDHRAGAIEDAPQHGNLVLRPAVQRAHVALGVFQRRRSAANLHLPHVGVPIAAADGHLRDQVVQVAFMQNHHAGMRHRRFVNENVMRIVAELV